MDSTTPRERTPYALLRELDVTAESGAVCAGKMGRARIVQILDRHCSRRSVIEVQHSTEPFAATNFA
ncbi:MAG: hypothetical protein ABW110_06140, partial [Steroidobacteraceae bacterium]